MALKRYRFAILAVTLITGCSLYAQYQYNLRYGDPGVQDRVQNSISGPEFYHDIKPILDNRCVVCHGCYDAPCQLKLTSFEGLDRGASKDMVYDGTRLLAAAMSRLYVDASTTEGWREKGFYPVLNEREQSKEANRTNSQLLRLLALKRAHPMPVTDLDQHFDFALKRDQQCPKIEELDSYESDYPLWGMPYGLPGIEQKGFSTIEQWVENGSLAMPFPPLSAALQKQVDIWERLFNGDALKVRLANRYLYEHLYLASLYFSDIDNRAFFHLVRSATPPGQPVQRIVTRRPFDDPGVNRVYYRLVQQRQTVVAKNHMPYALNASRVKKWRMWFYDVDYQVDVLPGYDPSIASNPFEVFTDIPENSRYRFLLDEARYTIMNFIKGPVCRGQIALNVINDHFWVLFSNPDNEQLEEVNRNVRDQLDALKMPAEASSNAAPFEDWFDYAEANKKYIDKRNRLLGSLVNQPESVSYDLLWNGDGDNPNAALTIFRHFDSASVEFGLRGGYPKTAWVINYTLLERIHYLLVAGFDVYGNVGHQLNTRLYMDFLRMEGEANFLAFFPPDFAREESARWYQGEEDALQDYLAFIADQQRSSSGIAFSSDHPKDSFFEGVFSYLGKKVVVPDPKYFSKPRTTYELNLFQLARLHGSPVQYLPEDTILRVESAAGEVKYYSLFVNRVHSNISSLFLEKHRLLPEEFNVSLLDGIYGTYPNLLLAVREDELGDLVSAIAMLDSEKAFEKLLKQFALSRSDKSFWLYSDQLHTAYKKQNPVEFGMLDYNRLIAY